MTPIQIVCPVDFSNHSRAALRYAGAWARRIQAKVSVLTAERFDIAPTPVPELLLNLGPGAVREKRALLRYLKEYARRFLGPDIPLSCRVWDGSPAEGILKHSRRIRASAVVMGTHARKGMPLARMGSVAERVADEIERPMMVVRSAVGSRSIGVRAWRGIRFRKVVLPLDTGHRWRRLHSKAVELLRLPRSVVHKVPVHDPSERSAARKVVSKAKRESAGLILYPLERERRRGAPMPSDGASELLRSACCPVLLLPGNGTR